MRNVRFIATIVAGAAALTAGSLVLAGCAPPYLEALDRAAALTHQMTMIGSVPTVGLQTSETNPRILPPKPTATSISGLNIQSGFLITDSAAGQNVSYAYVDSSGQTQTTSATSPFSMAGADPHFPLYQYEVAATTTTANLVVFYMNPTTPASSTAQLITATLPPSSTTAVVPVGVPPALTTYTGGPAVLGEMVAPSPSGAADNFRWLGFTAPNNFGEGPLFTLSTAAPIFNTVALATAPQATYPLVQRVMYYTTLTRSYVEYYSNGWICDDITGAAVQLTGITHRLDALLTTGDLLSTENDTLTLYDPNGNQLLSMPMGGLHFCYEAYIGSTPYVFFSLALKLQHNNWAFVFYAIPTSQVRGL